MEMTSARRNGMEKCVFNFHGVGQPHDQVPRDEHKYWCETEQFQNILDKISDLKSDSELEIEITVDDGNNSDIEIIAPELLKRDLTATFFVCSGRCSKPHYMNKAAWKELRDMGMRIGNHGADHINLRTANDTALAHETTGSRKILSEAIHDCVDAFAIPFGCYDRRVLAALRGYCKVYTSDHTRPRSASGWLVPRFSYTTAWNCATPEKVARQELSNLQRQKAAVKQLYKRLRGSPLKA